MVHLDQHYVDPRLVVLYDSENTRGAETDFYVRLAADLNAHTILDVGCGTGLLTRALAGESRRVIGVDPAPAMLAYARRQPGAERVQWVEGDSSALGTPNADLVIMTGNVAQVFLDDTEWSTTLHAIYAALRPGGYLAFESRNPEARAWEQWTRDATYTQTVTPDGPLEEWLEVVSIQDGRVRMEGHNVFTATGEVLVVPSELRFRNLEELTTSLTSAGFTVEQVYGDWNHGPVTSTSRIMVFVARRT
jgi:ubiquinone/menaquinone biosynthesis C-methylase UbiE